MSGQEASSDSPRSSPVDKLRSEMEEVLSGKPMNEESRDKSVFGRLNKQRLDIEDHETRLTAIETQKLESAKQRGVSTRTLYLGAAGTAIGILVTYIMTRVLGG